ncbi:uncharacterized protein LOC125355755 [Perognathus longimembris pacificus]|uniref:uncharacterized protein LOC125355755 n=1 Tax=Perognathus longimembris pacificus TaxID=214514 RepID=UPI002018A551|nr:uncharacterized protein LOC125355755 [Perognathus longimembris pacificus]
MVDTGAENSVLLAPRGPVSTKTTWVQGATGTKPYKRTTRRTVDLGVGRVTHSFLVIPDCPYPLLGRDLLTKMKAQIQFTSDGALVTDSKGKPVSILITSKLEDEYRLYQHLKPESPENEWLQAFPQTWAETGGMGLAKHHPPIFVELKAGADPIKVHQYPMSLEAKKGITPHIRKLLESGILKLIQSAWNTPLLPVRKPNSNDYRPVQDLREVNKRVMDIHPTVPNPYTLLSSLSPSHVWYTVLDLKDDFFKGVLKQPPNWWSSNALMVHYQTLLLNPMRISFCVPTALKPATLLPDPDLEAPLYDCEQILAQVHNLRPDLLDWPLPNAEHTWFTNGSSFIREGKRKIAIMHCPGHQKGIDLVTKGNNLADHAAKKAALQPRAEILALADPGPRALPPMPQYSQEDLEWIRKIPMAHKPPDREGKSEW